MTPDINKWVAPSTDVTPDQVVELLTKTKARIRHKQAWVQGEMAVTEWGDTCQTDDPNAARWCLLGALDRETAYWRVENAAITALKEAAGINHEDYLTMFNDGHTHADVLALLDKAIVLASQA